MKKYILSSAIAAIAIAFIAFLGISQSDLEPQVASPIDWGPSELGTVHGDGITHKEYPNGLDFPSFNNYTDNQGGEGIQDERQFLVGKNITKNDTEYKNDALMVNEGDIILLRSFIHNNGNPEKSDTTALNISTASGMTFAKNGKYFESTTAFSEYPMQQLLLSENSPPWIVRDTLTIKSESKKPIRLRYREGLSVISATGEGGYIPLNEEEFFSETGTSIGQKDTSGNSIFLGGAQNAFYTFGYFEVIGTPKDFLQTNSTYEPQRTCSCILTATPNTILAGQNSTLSWTTQNAAIGSIDQGIGSVTIPSGIKSVTPAQTTTYTLLVTGSNGETGNCQATVEIAPLSTNFSIDKRVWKGLSWGESASIVNGGIAYYRVAVKNVGVSPGNIILKDVLGGANNGGSLGQIFNEDIDCPLGATCEGSLIGSGISSVNIQPGDFLVVDYQRVASNIGVPVGGTSTIIDTASVSTGQNDTANVVISGEGQVPAFQIQKVISTDGNTYGESITRNNGESAYYKIIITNGGNAAGNATVIDTLSAPSNGGSLGAVTNENIQCSVGATCVGSLAGSGISITNLASGGSVVITYQRKVSITGIPNGMNSVVTDIAKLSTGDSDTANVTIRQSDVSPSFSVEKTVTDGIGGYTENITIASGAVASYKIIVRNDGTGNGNVTVTDFLTTLTTGGGLSTIANENIQCAAGATCVGSLAGQGIHITELAPNASVTILYNRTANMAGIPAGKNSVIVDSAKLSSGDSNEASVTIPGPVATPTCSNFIVIPPSVDPGAPFTLNWNSSSQQSFRIEGFETINPYTKNGVQTSFEITSGITEKTQFTLTVYNGLDQTGESVQCPFLFVPINRPSFEITKLVSDDGIDFSEDSVTIQDGESAYYAIVVQNTGTFTGTIGITDVASSATNGGSLTLNGPPLAIPPGICSSGNIFDTNNPLLCTLKPNGTVTITYSKTANDETIPPGKSSDFLNTATLLPTKQTGTAKVTVKGSAVKADLAVFINVDDENIPPNSGEVTQTLTYTVLWYNLGNLDMNNTTIGISCDADAVNNLQSAEGNISGNTITFGPFNTNSGEDGKFAFTADLKDGFGNPVDSFLCNAHIESADFLPISAKETNADNNDDSHQVNVDPINDDSRSKRVLSTRTGISGTYVSAIEGDELVYTLIYRTGDTPQNGFVFTDDISDILQYAKITDAKGGTVSGGIITWPAKNIPAYTSEEVQFTVKVFDDISTVNGDFKMRNTFGDEVTVSLPQVVLSKKVQVNNGEKKEYTSAKAGDILTYTLAVKNVGPINREHYVFSDDIADILEITDIIDLGGGTLTGTVISWPAVTILAGETVEKTFQVQIQSEFAEDEDCVLENVFGNRVAVSIPHVAMIKTVINERTNETGASVQAESGDELTFVLTAEEVGNYGDAEDFVFVDNVQDTLEYADISNISDGGTLDEDTEVITWPATDIAKGETGDRTFTATIKPENEWPAQGDFEITNIFGTVATVTVGKIVVDTILEKTVSKTEVAPTMEAVYTLTFRNIGDRTATNAFINDDYDETKIEIKKDTNGNPILPNNCVITETPALPSPIGGSKYIQCQLGNIPKNSDSFTLQYTAVVLDAEGVVNNTATISQDQVDEDFSNNIDSTSTPINTGGLIITKGVSPASVTTGQQATYTVRVTNSSPAEKSFTLTDVQSQGNNKGTLKFNNDGFSAAFTPTGSGTTAGTFANGGTVQITNLKPNASVIITYTRTADNAEIPFNLSSLFRNTATIGETGLFATADTFVIGPTKGGGGGGGGGGGIRRVSNSLNLYIEKEVKDTEGKWHDADSFDLAAIISSKKEQDTDYRITVRNEGGQTGKDIVIEDIFTSNTIKRTGIKNTEGATWNGNTQSFTISEIGSGKTATIRYTASLILQASFSEIASGKNTATITDAKVLSSASALVRSRTAIVKGIGGNDPAFVKTEIADTITLQKTVNKEVVKPGEETTFNIIVHNRGKMDYENLIITDSFPFAFLDLVQANDLREIDKKNQTMTFTKRTLKSGDIWIIKMKVKVKNSVQGNTKVRNSVTIAADNADLSGLYAYAEIIVTPLPQPTVLIKTGITSMQLAMILLGLVVLGFGGRQARKGMKK